MRLAALVLALIASGCFRWAPAESLADIQDDRVLVRTGNATETLEHATATGRTITGKVVAGETPDAVDTVDVREGRIFVRRLNGPATGAIVTASILATVGTALLVGLAVAAANARNDVIIGSF